jgi:3',5'-cyclic AMP phosphodiesterase CpdA
MILCQISDLHIKAGRKRAYGVVDTAGMLERCVAQIGELPQRPDALIVTGDLVDLGRPEEYGLLRELLAPLTLPFFLMPGNHDERDALRDAFPDHAYLRRCERFVQYVIDDLDVRLIALDTVIPGFGGGTLCEERLAWLDRTLAASDAPTIIAMHHPPFATGIGHMDKISLDNPGRMAQVVVHYPQVERVIAGHLHRPITARFAGTTASTCPSPAHQVALDLSVQAPDHFIMEPPGFQLHYWDGTALVTHTAYIGEFAGPYPFREGGELID